MVDCVRTNSELALDAILGCADDGVPSWLLHPMEHAVIERLAGAGPGEYQREPERVYTAMQRHIGTCLLDQWIPTNPLTMGDRGYQHAAATVTEGLQTIELDGIRIDSPEAVVEHLERCVFPALVRDTANFDEEARTAEIIAAERKVQSTLGPDILKAPYGVVRFPRLEYTRYGYEAFFSAYALYPEVIERLFSLQADLALRNNRAAARAYVEGSLPPFARLDHDIADSRGTLVDIRSLDRLWFPHFARCLEPVLKAGVRMIWHCDGNLMQMLPRLLDVGLVGFQGFQYEDGMDYLEICRMKPRDGSELIVIAGVSVTRTLPHGTPEDVRKELAFLVEHGPRRSLFLGGTSSITPGVPWENIEALVEGLKFYRRRGRSA